ncbi:hypothetical protein JL722_11849 [Aureococcus anophagefferens]|nr:hypothetical protein JL722_11849 [Aureococcus anophagefferens]
MSAAVPPGRADPRRTQPWRRFHFAQSGGLPGGMASLMEANDAGFGCDLALWEPVRLTAAVDGLAVGTAGVVVGWTGEAHRVAPSCITARERPVVARPEELAPRERPPIAGAEALARTPVVSGDSDFGACALCEAGGARKLGLVSPLYTCCGGSVCAPCASALGDHGIGDTCPLCGDAAHLKRGLEEVATVARRLARKGEPRAFYGLAAMDELLSVEESSRYLLALVPIFGEAPSVERALDLYAQAGARGSADALYALGVLRYVGHGPDCPRPRGNQIFDPTSIECSLIEFHAGPRDVAAALAHYGAAAELGHEGAMLCLYDALGDGDADGDEWLHHSAFLGDAAARALLAERGAEPGSPGRRRARASSRAWARSSARGRTRASRRASPRPAAAAAGAAVASARAPAARRATGPRRGPSRARAAAKGRERAAARGRAPPEARLRRGALRRLAHFNHSR